MPLAESLSEYVSACFTGLWIQSFEHEDGIPVFYPSRLAESLKRRRLDKIHDMFLDSQITLAEILQAPRCHIMLFRPR